MADAFGSVFRKAYGKEVSGIHGVEFFSGISYGCGYGFFLLGIFRLEAEYKIFFKLGNDYLGAKFFKNSAQAIKGFFRNKIFSCKFIKVVIEFNEVETSVVQITLDAKAGTWVGLMEVEVLDSNGNNVLASYQ